MPESGLCFGLLFLIFFVRVVLVLSDVVHAPRTVLLAVAWGVLGCLRVYFLFFCLRVCVIFPHIVRRVLVCVCCRCGLSGVAVVGAVHVAAAILDVDDGFFVSFTFLLISSSVVCRLLS